MFKEQSPSEKDGTQSKFTWNIETWLSSVGSFSVWTQRVLYVNVQLQWLAKMKLFENDWNLLNTSR
jgi:hypothetical protein